MLLHDCTFLLVVRSTCNAATLADRIETNAICDLADRVFFLLIAATYIPVFLKFGYLMTAHFRNEREERYKLLGQCFVGLFSGQALVMIGRWYSTINQS